MKKITRGKVISTKKEAELETVVDVDVPLIADSELNINELKSAVDYGYKSETKLIKHLVTNPDLVDNIMVNSLHSETLKLLFISAPELINKVKRSDAVIIAIIDMLKIYPLKLKYITLTTSDIAFANIAVCTDSCAYEFCGVFCANKAIASKALKYNHKMILHLPALLRNDLHFLKSVGITSY